MINKYTAYYVLPALSLFRDLFILFLLTIGQVLAQRAPLRVFHNDVPAVHEEYRKAYDVPAEAVPFKCMDCRPDQCAIDASIKSGRPFFIWASFFDPHPRLPRLGRA